MIVTILLKQGIIAKPYLDVKSAHTKDGFYVMIKEKTTVRIPVSEIKEIVERR